MAQGSRVGRRTSSIYALDGNGMFRSGLHMKSRHGYVNPAPAGWHSTVRTPKILSTYLKYNSLEKKFITQLVRRTEMSSALRWSGRDQVFGDGESDRSKIICVTGLRLMTGPAKILYQFIHIQW